MKNPIKSFAIIALLGACVVMVLPFVLLLIEAMFQGYDESILSKLINNI